MNKVVVNMNLTLDGVMQAPGRPDEDPRGGISEFQRTFFRAGHAHAGVLLLMSLLSLLYGANQA